MRDTCVLVYSQLATCENTVAEAVKKEFSRVKREVEKERERERERELKKEKKGRKSEEREREREKERVLMYVLL